MNASLSRLTGFATRYGFLAALVGFVGVFVTMVALRLVHPFELEWMEGAMVEHVQRIAGGRRIYVEPSLEFVPFIYPAAYFYLSAVIAKVTGVGFVALRLVSILSSVGVLVILYRFIDRETGDRVAAMAAVALFAGTYPLGGSFLDIGRADALYLLLLFAAFYIFRFHQSLGAHVAGGLLVALAFHTKQSALVTAAPVMLAAATLRRPHEMWL